MALKAAEARNSSMGTDEECCAGDGEFLVLQVDARGSGPLKKRPMPISLLITSMQASFHSLKATTLWMCAPFTLCAVRDDSSCVLSREVGLPTHADHEEVHWGALPRQTGESPCRTPQLHTDPVAGVHRTKCNVNFGDRPR